MTIGFARRSGKYTDEYTPSDRSFQPEYRSTLVSRKRVGRPVIVPLRGQPNRFATALAACRSSACLGEVEDRKCTWFRTRSLPSARLAAATNAKTVRESTPPLRSTFNHVRLSRRSVRKRDTQVFTY